MLEKQVGWTLIAGRRHNKIGLRKLGSRHPRAGTTYRVTFPRAIEVLPLQTGFAATLAQYARGHAGPWPCCALE